MQTRTTYRQLQPEERMTLASMCQARSSVRAMARALERSPLAADNYLECAGRPAWSKWCESTAMKE